MTLHFEVLQRSAAPLIPLKYWEVCTEDKTSKNCGRWFILAFKDDELTRCSRYLQANVTLGRAEFQEFHPFALQRTLNRELKFVERSNYFWKNIIALKHSLRLDYWRSVFSRSPTNQFPFSFENKPGSSCESFSLSASALWLLNSDAALKNQKMLLIYHTCFVHDMYRTWHVQSCTCRKTIIGNVNRAFNLPPSFVVVFE